MINILIGKTQFRILIQKKNPFFLDFHLNFCVKLFKKEMSILNCFLVFSILIWVSITEDFDVTNTNSVTPSNVNGIFFDLKPKRSVRIKSFTFTKGGNPSVHNVSIYIKIFPGTFVGYENDPSVWQLWHTYQFNSTKAKTTKSIYYIIYYIY